MIVGDLPRRLGHGNRYGNYGTGAFCAQSSQLDHGVAVHLVVGIDNVDDVVVAVVPGKRQLLRWRRHTGAGDTRSLIVSLHVDSNAAAPTAHKRTSADTAAAQRARRTSYGEAVG